jgi:hypothetical protein
MYSECASERNLKNKFRAGNVDVDDAGNVHVHQPALLVDSTGPKFMHFNIFTEIEKVWKHFGSENMLTLCAFFIAETDFFLYLCNSYTNHLANKFFGVAMKIVCTRQACLGRA